MNMRLGRAKTYVFASLWKIGLTLACAYILVPNMTPLGDLFIHIGNETAYDNRSLRAAVRPDAPSYYVPPYEGNNDGNPIFADNSPSSDNAGFDFNTDLNEDDARRIAAPRFRRFSDSDLYNDNFDSDFMDVVGQKRSRRQVADFRTSPVVEFAEEPTDILNDDPIGDRVVLNDDPVDGGVRRTSLGGEVEGTRRPGLRRRRPTQRPPRIPARPGHLRPTGPGNARPVPRPRAC